MRTVFISALVAALVSLGLGYGMAKYKGSSETANKETSYERVQRTGTLRCAYFNLNPISYKDPKTGELKGFGVYLFQELSKRLSLKADWVEEVNFATMMTGLDAGRYDAICTGVWLSAERAKVMEYTWPYMFSSVVPIVRGGDTRFDADVNAINDKAVKIAAQDNLILTLANTMFPEAKKVQEPEMSPYGQVFLDVETGKADLTLTDASDFSHYAANNPGKLRMIHADRPLRLFPWVIPVRKGEHTLASLINGALAEMVFNDDIKRITERNGVTAGAYGYVRPSVELR